MRRFALVPAVCFVASVASLTACAANTDSEEATENQESDIKKKVKPRGGNGALDLAKPSWATSGAVGQYVFDGKNVAIDSRTEKVPGSYMLATRVTSFESGQTMGQAFDGITIKAGSVEKRTVTGLRVRFDKPLGLGGSRFEMTPLPGGNDGWLNGRGSWSKNVNGILLLVAAGKIRTVTGAESNSSDLTLAEGKLTEVVLPTSKLQLQADAYDADYPTPTNCPAPYLTAGANGDQETVPVRDQNGVPFAGGYVPQGTRAPVTLRSYGMIRSIPTVANQTHSFLVNRLEVDDVEVTAANGGTQMVRGTYTVEYKDGAVYRMVDCASFPTHSGIDLPDGDYRITSRAQSASGIVTYSENVSFP